MIKKTSMLSLDFTFHFLAMPFLGVGCSGNVAGNEAGNVGGGNEAGNEVACGPLGVPILLNAD